MTAIKGAFDNIKEFAMLGDIPTNQNARKCNTD